MESNKNKDIGLNAAKAPKPKRPHGLFSFFTDDSETRKARIEEVKRDKAYYEDVVASLTKERSISPFGSNMGR